MTIKIIATIEIIIAMLMVLVWQKYSAGIFFLIFGFGFIIVDILEEIRDR